MNDNNQPILYSFRRCPYAMRARLALTYAEISLEHREIILRNKPQSMLSASPKGTVPVLILPEGKVIDESLDIMLWALAVNDPQHWVPENSADKTEIMALIQKSDFDFKPQLDRYKYADRHPEHPMEYYRSQGELFIELLNSKLSHQNYLMGQKVTLADMAIVPFIRQFAHVDRDWFYSTSYKGVQKWLTSFIESELFLQIMAKHPLWE
ncbi:glutathione S-transferase [Endozoicomonas numazuensis]|uniref:Glutathione S-transferase n=1 Tax=Endozoicomonas numazuensis TaxID=1137799 RepID=A0A081NM67_9GAMM|nr:glutathione S-transferase [Endozoicomonas numazuensis]KEQ19540.1 glutathione S-transferase [Endozoicomonas numazuensis]